MTYVARFVSLAVATVHAPASTTGTLPATSHLAAIGMLVAERRCEQDWRFSLHTHAVGAGDGEDRLLAWATGVLPDSGIVIGWKLAEAVLPPLLDAGATGDPEISRAFLDQLLKLVTAPSVDLALPHGGAGAAPLQTVAGRHGIALGAMTEGEIESAWAFGNRRLLAGHVEDCTVATWRLWLAEANGVAAAASQAFESWLRT